MVSTRTSCNNIEIEKSLLMKLYDKSGYALYDHLKDCIRQLLVYSTGSSLDTFELLSEIIKDEKNPVKRLNRMMENPAYLSTALVQRKLFIKGEYEEEKLSIEDGMEFPLPNLMDLSFNWNSAGIGIGSYDKFQLNLAFKVLVNLKPIKIGRFWGKIFGILQNYFIVEVEFEERDDDEMDEEYDEDENNPEDQGEDVESDSDEIKDVLPKSKWKAPPTVPKEVNQTGVNRKAYFVCHNPGLSWMRLPLVTPQQIVAARSIFSLFTGVLDAPVMCSPAFPGTEAHYLRAQIARISSCTHISPDGYFHFDEGGDEEDEVASSDADDEEATGARQFTRNEEYEPMPLAQLVDSRMQHWVHHMPYILPQGRTTWWNPAKSQDDIDEMDEEEEEEAEGEGVGRIPPEPAQRGPPILSRVSADAAVFGEQAWSTRLSSQALPEHAGAVALSNIWPGAYAITMEKQFDNIYVGFGLKATGGGFQPYLPPAPWSEFKDELSLPEAFDPTPDEEAALRALKEENMEDNEGVDDEGDEGDQGESDEAEA